MGKTLVRKPDALLCRFADRIEKVMDVSIAREITGWNAVAGAGDGRLGARLSACSEPLGHHDQLQAIAASKNTSLAVVAPGIAEALFATRSAYRLPFLPHFHYKFTSEVNGRRNALRLCGRFLRNPVTAIDERA